MSTSVTAPKPTSLLDEAPALWNPGWIPPEAWPELSEMREQHIRILGEFRRTARSYSDLTRRYEHEDEARTEALQEGYRLGTEPERLDSTPPEERQARLAEAKLHYDAAREALERFLREALAQLKADQPKALERLREHACELEEKREAARRLLAEAEAATGDLDRLHTWVMRSASDHPAFQVVWEHLQPTLPEEQIEWAKDSVRPHDELKEAFSDAYQ